ncbi:MAG: hypothetical protein HW401_230 [Parcubacteria group bacterium]|nr:hypothetical protein [Parcubacteria group bacterium]
MNKKGFIKIAFVVLIVVVVIVAGYFSLVEKQAPSSQQNDIPSSIDTQTSKSKTLISDFTQSDIKKFLPAKAIFNKELRLDLEGDGIEEVAFSYAIPLNQENTDFNTGVKILKQNNLNDWQVAFEDTDRVSSGGGPKDLVNIQKVKVEFNNDDGGLSGEVGLTRSNANQIFRKEAVLIILTESGAGTATRWHLLASVNDKISKLDPSLIRNRVFADLGYQDLGYNGVKIRDDFEIIETQPGYSKDAARCCPDKPSIEISFLFSGNSLELGSIKKLEFNLQTYRNDKYGFELGYSSKLKPYIVEADGKNFTSNKTSPCLLLGDFYDKSELEARKNTDNYTQSYLSLCLLDDQMIFGQANPNRTLEDYAKTRYAPPLHNQFIPVNLSVGMKALELNTSSFRTIYIRLKSGKVLEVSNPELLKGVDVMEIIKSTIIAF